MAWRDDFVLHLIDCYNPDYIQMPPQTMVELSNEYMDENNAFTTFAQQFVEPSDLPDAYFTIKQAKLLLPLFQDFLKSHGRARVPIPAKAEFRKALSMASELPATCRLASLAANTISAASSSALGLALSLETSRMPYT